jgi:hypothetical protein
MQGKLGRPQGLPLAMPSHAAQFSGSPVTHTSHANGSCQHKKLRIKMQQENIESSLGMTEGLFKERDLRTEAKVMCRKPWSDISSTMQVPSYVIGCQELSL